MTLGAQGMKLLIQLGTLVVLARLLPPAAFGLIAMVGALTALLDVVKEFGFSAVTIQKPKITHAQISTLFWINRGPAAGQPPRPAGTAPPATTPALNTKRE